MKRLILFSFLTLSLFGKEYTIDHALVSIYAVRDDGSVVIDQNSDLSLVPASCMKIVTTGAALHLLGAESRFETDLEYDGVVEDQTLHGNLYIRGGGDPTLGSDRIPGALSWKKQIESWADAIQEQGIQKIKGKIIPDATRWEKALAVPSWTLEDVGNYFGAGASALSFHENLYSLIFKPGGSVDDDAAILRSDPPLSTLVLRNEVKTGPEGSGDCACIYGTEFSSTQCVRGTIPFAVQEFAIKGAIPDPAVTCSEFLAIELQKRGIILEKESLPSSKRIKFHTTYSPTIGEIVHWTNQKSINLYAEHLLKKMGEMLHHDGSTDAGIKAVTDFWKTQKIDLGGFNMADGSGLSRKNLITTKQLVEILLKMKKSSFFPHFLDSLPQKENAIRAKSGSMSLIKGYAGYSGDIAFAILVNHCADPKLKNEKIDQFLSDLNQF